MTCKGICIRHEAARPADGYRYSNGQNRCRVCDLFIEWGGVKCPCCGMTLSTRQHRSKTWGSIKNSVRKDQIDGDIPLPHIEEFCGIIVKPC